MFTNKKLGITLYIVSFVACIARIMAGVHYPSDILGGIVLGVATAYMLHIVWRVSKPTS
jgi:membrane-associated phospholipid phosphatase